MAVGGESTRFARHYYYRACPMCEHKPLERGWQNCPACGVALHQFSLTWMAGRSPRSTRAVRVAKKLGQLLSVGNPSRYLVTVNGGMSPSLVEFFTALAIDLHGLAGSEVFHVGRSCRANLPAAWWRCFFGKIHLQDAPDMAKRFAFEGFPDSLYLEPAPARGRIPPALAGFSDFTATRLEI